MNALLELNRSAASRPRSRLRPWGAAAAAVLTAAGFLLLLPGRLSGESLPEPVPGEGLSCQALDDGVHIEWSIEFFAPIEGFILDRDGVEIAKLPPGARSYFDPRVAAGSHLYVLSAINFTGDISPVGRCAVAVQPPGLRCSAEGNEVKLEWGPILIDVLILKFRITRNGDAIADLPPERLSHSDQVPAAGRYEYAVFAVVGEGSAGIPAPEFLVGKCVVDVHCFGIQAAVDGLKVHLAWEPPPVAGPLPLIFTVARDHEVVAQTRIAEHTDQVPSPGRYLYDVSAGFEGGASPELQIGSCIVIVPGDGLPAPEDFRCTAALPVPDPLPFDPANGLTGDPAAIDTDGDGVADAVFPAAVVVLSWTNAAAYDAIIISRDGALLIRLPGSAMRYLDPAPAPGIHRYEVEAVRGGARSLARSCQVEIPGTARNLLFFSGPAPAQDGGVVPEPLPGDRITCRASNSAPLQGWSFGVATDPEFIAAESTSIEDTATAALNGGDGPAFLHLEISAGGGGVVMAAVVSRVEPFDALPPGDGHRILHIQYRAGPSGTPGIAHPVRYSNAIGSPPVQIVFVVEGFEVKPAVLPGAVVLPGPRFRRGDANSDGVADISDALAILGWLFLGEEVPGCLEAANTNGSAEVNIADPVYLLQFQFNGGPPLPPPFPQCGIGPAPLGCRRYDGCEL